MDVKESVTVVGAVIAAISSCWNLWLQLRKKRDRFRVELGGISPANRRETLLNVVNLGDSPIHLDDYGFIESNGFFSSILSDVANYELEPGDVVSSGLTLLQSHGDAFEVGYVRGESPIGAFAKSRTRKRARIAFSHETPWHLRLRIRVRLLCRPNYFQWPFSKRALPR